MINFARTPFLALAVTLALAALFMPEAHAASRIKDLAAIEGVRSNQLQGYGIVVGLNGTGDSLNNSPMTKQSLTAMLEQLGVNTAGATLRTANVAAVMVTANLPPFSTQGSRIDVTISAMGDAKSLQGGTLLFTPLLGADNEIYATAQGQLSVGGFTVKGDAASVTRGVPTSARIASGAVVEREIGFKLASMNSLRLALRNPDFTTARRIAMAINDLMGTPVAEPTDPATVRLTLPDKFNGNIVDLVTDIEQLAVDVDTPAKVIIDDASGIIVMGQDVRVSTVAVAQGNLTVTVTEQPQVSQPGPLSNGTTTVVPRTQITVEDGSKNHMAVVKNSVSLRELVDGLNALGVGPRDLITILQAIKASGAMQADIELM
ncbi:MAG: flagellar basal body P-ring protein FlgI [Ancalomicrobiaceae bacterium]|nr:flagellar basal body P-ring protein FlgI [Ancalomicrobiaceae bacterium]